MRFLSILAALALVAAPLAAQKPFAMEDAKYSPVPNPTFEIPGDLLYKVAWNVLQGAAKPDETNDAFKRIASFVNSSGTAGVSRDNLHYVMVVHGAAGIELLSNTAYHARLGVDNPNAALLEGLSNAGVKIVLCGQTIVTRKLDRDQLLPFVRVALSATWAFAVLQAQGYHVNPF
ncbi:MAG TPA: DsrE family protein [Gemmatimonadaceae bacterium]|nr:DsrE family protein [Gemmatimonadaceae bacterium]